MRNLKRQKCNRGLHFRRIGIVNFMALLPVLFLISGCTHHINFTEPAVPELAATANGKGGIRVISVEDKRPPGTEMFVFSNPPHSWIYHPDLRAEDSVRNLLRAGLKRRGYMETVDGGEGLKVHAEVMEYSGNNVPGAFYVGQCLFKITCAVNLDGYNGKKTFSITANGENYIGRLTDENMTLLLNLTYEDFLKKLDQELANAGY